ncbi:jg7208 [Pararge aegeria aegeria]|uniref:Jg7208 protein n=1 Tax=Pararge aegeria aegeria TaxID=348720 RepID=A0A8S4QZJ7_9NEOP|nr:jg7208 [Pararge aegeria aegeria]
MVGGKTEKFEEVGDPFARGRTIQRTPPGLTKEQESMNTGSDASADTGETDNCEDDTPSKEGERRPKKRKKVSSPIMVQPSEIEPSEELMKIKAKVEELVNFTKGNKKVHHEVKTFALDLTSLVRQTVIKYKYDTVKFYELQQEFNTYKETQEQRVSELSEQIEYIRQDYENRFEQLSNERGDSYVECNLISKKLNLNHQDIKDYDNLLTKLHLEWTLDSFRNVKIVHGDIFQNVCNNVVYFCEEQTKSQSRSGKRVLNRYPEILEGERIICDGGSYNIMEQSVTLLTSEDRKMRTNKVVVAFYDPTKQDGRSQHDVFKLCEEIKRLAEKFNMKEISIVNPQGVSTDVMRKMLETIFHNTDISVFLKAKKNKLQEKKNTNKKTDEIIVIKGDTDSYAYVLKKLKNGLKGRDALEQIKGVQETKKGDILVKVKENAEGVTKIIKDIVQNKKIKTLIRKTKCTLHIKDIDSIADIEEVRTAVLDTNIVQSPDILEVRSLRPMKNGNQIATIVLDKTDGEGILKINRLRIGLSICQVYQRIDVLKCYRCWSYDHIAAKCTGEDRSLKCHCCAQEGHLARNCTNEAFCPLCNTEGHSSGSGRCKFFHQALARTNRRRRDSVSTRYQHSQSFK